MGEAWETGTRWCTEVDFVGAGRPAPWVAQGVEVLWRRWRRRCRVSVTGVRVGTRGGRMRVMLVAGMMRA